nr:hypothetical protein [candidate division Zixibacteria bacterium]
MFSRKSRPPEIVRNRPSARSAKDFIFLSHQILQLADRRLRRSDFMRKIASLLVNFSECDELEIRLGQNNDMLHCICGRNIDETFHLETRPCLKTADRVCLPCLTGDHTTEIICQKAADISLVPSPPLVANKGSLCINFAGESIRIPVRGQDSIEIKSELFPGFQSTALMPFETDDGKKGLLILKARPIDYFTYELVEAYEEISHILGMTISYRSTRVALRERVKELTCLYRIARAAANPDRSIDDILREGVQLLPPGWLHPEIAAAQIELDGRRYATISFDRCVQKIGADIISLEVRRGRVEVGYVKIMPELDEGAFLREERDLIDAVAAEIAMIIERRQAEEDKINLQEQLRHADRLATIGQLAAGVAHELNEPLGSILGFAQLARKDPETPAQVGQDLEKIEAASLHAREIVKKLMLFARQAPAQKESTNLNRIIKDSLFLLESRCAKAGIILTQIYYSDLPDIRADAGQISQVLVNLVVNAIQAMPRGGNLTIETDLKDDQALLIVADTGHGIDKKVIDKIFLPFYTTKDINEGTGLGLAVVQGIVVGHGGSIGVDSEPGKGARFEVCLPLVNGNHFTGNGEIEHD